MLNQNLELLIYSYLTLEETLILFRNQVLTRDLLIKLYHQPLPKIEQVCEDGQLQTLKYLVSIKIYPTEPTLYYATMNGHLDIVKYLSRDYINARSQDLDIATKNKHKEIVKFLIEQQYEASEDAIYYAGLNNDLEMMKLLFDHGTEVPWETINVVTGNIEIVKYLFGRGIPGHTAIVIAVKEGHLNVVQYLTEQGVRTTEDLLELARSYNQLAIVQYLESIDYLNNY